jgi:hypothetical protein
VIRQRLDYSTSQPAAWKVRGVAVIFVALIAGITFFVMNSQSILFPSRHKKLTSRAFLYRDTGSKYYTLVWDSITPRGVDSKGEVGGQSVLTEIREIGVDHETVFGRSVRKDNTSQWFLLRPHVNDEEFELVSFSDAKSWRKALVLLGVQGSASAP